MGINIITNINALLKYFCVIQNRYSENKLHFRELVFAN